MVHACFNLAMRIPDYDPHSRVFSVRSVKGGCSARSANRGLTKSADQRSAEAGRYNNKTLNLNDGVHALTANDTETIIVEKSRRSNVQNGELAHPAVVESPLFDSRGSTAATNRLEEMTILISSKSLKQKSNAN